MIEAVLGLVQAIPILDKWMERLVAAYVASRISSMQQENREALRKAIELHDQRDLEAAIGHPSPGAPSGIPGTTLRDSLPGVKK